MSLQTKSKTTLQAIPPVSLPPELAALAPFVDAVRESLNVMRGEAGFQLDRAVTLRDLYNSGQAVMVGGILMQTAGSLPGPGGGIVPEGETETAGGIPDAVTGLAAAGALTTVILEWDAPGYSGHAYTEIWRAEVNDVGASALVGRTQAYVFSDSIGQTGGTYYYWARNVSVYSVPGPFNAVDGTIATLAYVTSPDLTDALITTEKLANQAVDTNRLASLAVTAAQLAGGSVTNPKLAAAAVQDTNIANGAVTWATKVAGTGKPDDFADVTAEHAAGLLNPNFEGGDTGWWKGTGFTIVNDGNAIQGSWSAKFTGSSSAQFSNLKYVSAVPGDVFTWVALGKKTSGTITGRLIAYSYDSTGLLLNGSGGFPWQYADVVFTTDNEVKTMRLVQQILPGTAYVGLLIEAYPTGTATAYFDAVDYSRQSAPTNTDGLINPYFEDGDVGWEKEPGCSIIFDPANAFTGNWVAYIASTGTADTGYFNQRKIAATPGDRIFAACYAKKTAGPGTTGLWISWYKANNDYISSESNSVTSSSYVRIPVIGVAPADTAYCLISPKLLGPDATSRAYFDQFEYAKYPKNSDIDVSQTANVGAFATLNQITGDNISTYMAAAAIGTAYIANAAVGAAAIAGLAVGTAHIADGAILTAKIGDAQISTAKIVDAAITNAKIGSAAVDSAQIATAAIVTAKIADGNITTAKIATAAITTALIATAAITNAKIGTAEVGTLTVAGNAITFTQSAFTSGNLTLTTSYQDVQTISYTNTGDGSPWPCLILAHFNISNTGIDDDFWVQVLRDSTVLYGPTGNLLWGEDGEFVTMMFMDTPPSSGTYTYKIQVKRVSSGTAITVQLRSLAVLGTKR